MKIYDSKKHWKYTNDIVLGIQWMYIIPYKWGFSMVIIFFVSFIFITIYLHVLYVYWIYNSMDYSLNIINIENICAFQITCEN